MEVEFSPEMVEKLGMPFSIFGSFDEHFYFNDIQMISLKRRIKEYKKIRARLDKMVNKGEILLHVFDPQFLDNETTKELVIWTFLPKVSTDYFAGVRIWWESKNWYNFKCIFKPFMIFPTLVVQTINEEIKRDLFDVLLVQTKEEYYEKNDVAKYMRMWLMKYYPDHNLTVKYLEGE